jgi:hypothetical protein
MSNLSSQFSGGPNPGLVGIALIEKALKFGHNRSQDKHTEQVYKEAMDVHAANQPTPVGEPNMAPTTVKSPNTVKSPGLTKNGEPKVPVKGKKQRKGWR